MDLTIPQGVSDEEALATLCQSASKDRLANYARGRCNWKGDDARTPKTDIARAILEWHKANPGNGAPAPAANGRQISARFPGKCAHCQGAIQRGESIFYVKATHSAYHVPCWTESASDSGAEATQERADGEPTKEQPVKNDRAPEAPRKADGTPAAMIAEALRQMLASMPAPMDEERVKEIAGQAATDAAVGMAADLEERFSAALADQLAKLPTKETKIIVKDGAEVARIEEHTHPVFEKCLRLLNAGASILLKGPAGCGKSFLAEQLSRAMKLANFGALHCSAGASESQLLGWLLPTGEGGRFEYVPAQFARLYAEGNAAFLIDEIDAADPNFLMVLNGALANGHLHVPQNWKQPSVERGANFHIVAAANTYGTGADALYVGRNQLDAATLDRFYVVEMDYDRKLEEKLAPAQVCAWAWDLRDKAARAKLRRVVSTRVIQRMGLAMGAGFTFEQAKADALVGWTRDELSKVGL